MVRERRVQVDPGRGVGDVEAQLGHPVAGAQLARQCVQPGHQIGRHGGAAPGDELEPGEIAGPEIRVVRHHVELHRRAEHVVDPFLLEQAQQIARIEAVLEHQGAPDIEPEDAGHPDAGNMVDRHHVEQPRPVHRPVLVLDRRADQERPVRDHRSLGPAGGAGGEDQHRGIVESDGAPRGVEPEVRPGVAAGEKLGRRRGAVERLVQRDQTPDGRVLPHECGQHFGIVAAVDAAEGDQDGGLRQLRHVPELGHPVTRVIAGPDGADLGRRQHDRQPLGRRRSQRGDPVSTGDARRQQGPGPAGDGPIEIAVAEPRRTVNRGLAAGLARGMKADALADPPGIDGQHRHAPSAPGAARFIPPIIAPSGEA